MTSASATRIARRFVQAMAFDRDTYKNRLGEYIGGAYLEFYKARLASKNGFAQWVEHWMTEVKRLLDTEPRPLSSRTTSGAWGTVAKRSLRSSRG